MTNWWFIDDRELKVESRDMPRNTNTEATNPPPETHSRSAEEEQLERLRQEMEDDDGSPPEMWDPEPGESLIAELLRYEERSTKVGPCRVAVVREAATDELYSVWLSRSVLKNEFDKQSPRPGDMLGLKFHGEKTTRNGQSTYFLYSLRVVRTKAAEQLQGAVGAPPVSTRRQRRRRGRRRRPNVMLGHDNTEGLAAELVARVATAPKARFFPSGELIWEFNLRLVMDARTETLTVRAPDQHYGSLQNWATPGKLMYIRGWLHLVRWTADGKDKARLVVDPVELMPLGMNIQGGAPAAMDYSSAPRPPKAAAPEVQAQQPVESNKARRAQRARQLLEEAEPA